MVDKLPVDLTAGTANRGSLVHASDADIAGVLSRAHLEEDISRVQSAVLAFNTSNTYKTGDFVLESTITYRAANANGPGAFTVSDWIKVSESQERINVTNLADQAITATGDTDIVGLTVTLENEPGEHSLVIFNINYTPNQNDKDVMFRVSDNAVAVNDYAKFAGEGGDRQSVRITYIAESLGQVVKAVCARDGGTDPSGTITILGATVPPTSMQVLELG